MPEPPHEKPRMHNVLPNSRAYIYHVGKHARRIGVDIRTGTRATRFLVEGGRVTGAACDGPDGPIVFMPVQPSLPAAITRLTKS